jgi:hypothetical protein
MDVLHRDALFYPKHIQPPSNLPQRQTSRNATRTNDGGSEEKPGVLLFILILFIFLTTLLKRPAALGVKSDARAKLS